MVRENPTDKWPPAWSRHLLFRSQICYALDLSSKTIQEDPMHKVSHCGLQHVVASQRKA